MVDSLDEEDVNGAIALLVRLVRVQNERDRVGVIKAAATEAYASLDAQWVKCRKGFAVFGFDPNDKDLWDHVRNAVGPHRFSSAFDRAKAAPLPPVLKMDVIGEDNDAEDQQWIDNESDENALNLKSSEHKTASTDEKENQLTSRQIVIHELAKAGSAGLSASVLRDTIQRRLGREIHYKTTGMTLYRLSQEGLVTREGRTWFIVPTMSEMVNPGGHTPGLEEFIK